MGTATTVTTTEDGITVAYLTTTDEHGQYIAAVDADGTPVALVQEAHQQEEAMEDDGSKAIEETMMGQ